MRSLLLLSISFLLSAGSLQSQSYNPLHPPNSFRSSDNPLYWNNQKPHQEYWQQDVHYRIKAEVDEQTDIITGEEHLTYWNNSPDTLRKVYFHLYQNAFQPGSHYDDLLRNNKIRPQYGHYEEQGKGTDIQSLRVEGKTPETKLDNTVLRVDLPSPLPPGKKVEFAISFRTYFDQGSIHRRMQMFTHHGYKHYNGAHWYPRISVYDRKFGWTTDQHLRKEFYGDFGTFDVKLNFAHNFIVEATGNLLNREEMLPPDLRAQLSIENFSDKPRESAPSEIIPYDSTRHKTWHFYAENVHDFAFTADPTYRIGEARTEDGVTCYALAMEENAAGWQNAAEYAARAVEVFNQDIGSYEYPKMVVADARDGMEYPMLTLDGGADPGYRDLLVHEIGHNWFYGMVGTNETYRAAMDEGFTQFLTSWGLERIDGDTAIEAAPPTSYERTFREPQNVRMKENYYGYLNKALRKEDAVLNQHSHDFEGTPGHGGGYRQVYYKMSTMLYNLQYVLGDSLFLAALQHYFQQWRFAHPYFEDFRNSMINYTGVDLNWFFDQWWNTTKRIDYAIKGIRKATGEDAYRIRLERKGEMQMPIDLAITSHNDSVYHFHIPNTWFIKETDAKVLPKWTQSGKLHPEYTVTVTIPGGIANVEIDPSGRLADVYRLNDHLRTPVDFGFDHRLSTNPDPEEYEVKGRPALWYNGYDGFQFGTHINGGYMEYAHQFDVTVWMNTGLMQNMEAEREDNAFMPLSYLFNYRTGLARLNKGLSLDLSSRYLAGLSAYEAGFVQEFPNDKTTVSARFRSMYRGGDTHFSDRLDEVTAHNYLLYPSEWGYSRLNNAFNFLIDHKYQYSRGSGDLELNLRSPAPGSDYDFTKLSLEARNETALGSLELTTRFFAQYGTGDEVPPESALFMAGGNPEAMMESPFTRAVGFFPNEWMGYGANTNHFQYGGGLNLRGYAGYLAPEEDHQDSLHYTYRGTSGAAINAELAFDRLIGWDPFGISRMLDLRPYFFGDAGTITYNTSDGNPALTNIRVDAGVGATLTLHRIGPLTEIDPITLRFDAPLFLNRIPAVTDEHLAFRWVMGIGKSF